MRLSAILLTLCIGITLSIACVTTESGRKQLSLVPDSQMNAMGAQAYQDILSKSSLSQNSSLNQSISHIGRKIALASGVQYDWEFKVIDEAKTVNAFCLPGGKVAVYTGIIPVAKNNAALAAVLGHEVAHAVLRHSAERMSQQMVVQLGLAASSLSFKDSKNRNLIAGLLGIGAVYGVALPFGRFQESEADRVGLDYTARAGFDPRESIALWERMGASGSRPPEILSTHPDPLRRAKELEKMMPRALALFQSAPSKEMTRNF